MILTGRDTREAQQAFTLDPLTTTLRATEGLVSDGYRMTSSNGETEDNRKAYKRGMVGGDVHMSLYPSLLTYGKMFYDEIMFSLTLISYSFFGRYLWFSPIFLFTNCKCKHFYMLTSGVFVNQKQQRRK